METKTGLAERFIQYRNKTIELCTPLHTEDFSSQPMVDVSPPKWNLGHTTWFFEKFILLPYCKNYNFYNNDYHYLFNSYYESAGERLARDLRGNLSRPSVKEILKYRNYVDEYIAKLTESENLPTEALNIFELGLQHEQQHQELMLTDIKYILGNNPLQPAYIQNSEITFEPLTDNPIENYIDIPEGLYNIGFESEGFCFDNEKGAHKIFLHSFNIMDRLVTNLEYLQFIEDKGYEKFQFWLQEGWEWVKQNKIEHPLYWRKEDNEWFVYSLKGLKKLNPFEPVIHVSYYEADAYAKWKQKRLLTEFEWEVASKIIYQNIPENANFLEENHFDTITRQNFSSQLFGDAWEWTCSAYLPYPYFKTQEGSIGEYNGKFMINQMVLKGGSFATPRNHIRHTYRNFFHPDKRWQITGIRLADSN
jgi:ergothioneine biosynthesis protein EgtB